MELRIECGHVLLIATEYLMILLGEGTVCGVWKHKLQPSDPSRTAVHMKMNRRVNSSIPFLDDSAQFIVSGCSDASSYAELDDHFERTLSDTADIEKAYPRCVCGSAESVHPNERIARYIQANHMETVSLRCVLACELSDGNFLNRLWHMY